MKKQREHQELEREAKKLAGEDALEKVDQMQFEENEDDLELARMNIDAQEVRIVAVIIIYYYNYSMRL